MSARWNRRSPVTITTNGSPFIFLPTPNIVYSIPTKSPSISILYDYKLLHSIPSMFYSFRRIFYLTLASDNSSIDFISILNDKEMWIRYNNISIYTITFAKLNNSFSNFDNKENKKKNRIKNNCMYILNFEKKKNRQQLKSKNEKKSSHLGLIHSKEGHIIMI